MENVAASAEGYIRILEGQVEGYQRLLQDRGSRGADGGDARHGGAGDGDAAAQVRGDSRHGGEGDYSGGVVISLLL